MLQVRGGLDLGEKSLGPDDSGELRSEDLDRHPAIVPDVVRQIHRGHPTGAELPLDGVAVRQRGRESMDGVAHRYLAIIRARAAPNLFSTTVNRLASAPVAPERCCMMNERSSGATS